MQSNFQLQLQTEALIQAAVKAAHLFKTHTHTNAHLNWDEWECCDGIFHHFGIVYCSVQNICKWIACHCAKDLLILHALKDDCFELLLFWVRLYCMCECVLFILIYDFNVNYFYQSTNAREAAKLFCHSPSADKRSKYILWEANNSCASYYHSLHFGIVPTKMYNSFLFCQCSCIMLQGNYFSFHKISLY